MSAHESTVEPHADPGLVLEVGTATFLDVLYRPERYARTDTLHRLIFETTGEQRRMFLDKTHTSRVLPAFVHHGDDIAHGEVKLLRGGLADSSRHPVKVHWDPDAPDAFAEMLRDAGLDRDPVSLNSPR